MEIEVSFNVEVPDGTTYEQAKEWLLFELGANCEMSMKNPLDGTDLAAYDVRLN